MEEPASPAPPLRFETRAEYRAWALAQPRGRTEWVDGEVVAMAAERVGHARTKLAATIALQDAIAAAGVPCEALPDGITVEVGPKTDYEPDVVVNCGDRLDDERLDAPNPVILVEVMSRSTQRIDTTQKLTDYFLLPSVRHYLILRRDRRIVVHHRRNDDGGIDTRLLTAGPLVLDPPGLTVPVERLFGSSL